MMDFLEIFRDEVDGNLREATRLTLDLESGEPAREQTEALMRVFHSLKGAARAMQFDDEKRTAHLLEDVYHDLLEGRAEYRPELADLSLQAIDLIRDQVAARLASAPVPDSTALAEQAARYRAGEPLAASGTSASQGPADGSAPQRDGPGAGGPGAPTQAAGVARAEPEAASKDAPEGEADGMPAPAEPPASEGADSEVTGDADLFGIFRAEARAHLEQCRAVLDALDAEGFDPERVRALERSFHTLKGAARAIGLDAIRDAAGAGEALVGEVGAGTLPGGADFNVLVRCVCRWIDRLMTEGIAGGGGRSLDPLHEQLARYRRGEPAGDCSAPGNAAASSADDTTASSTDAAASQAPPADAPAPARAAARAIDSSGKAGYSAPRQRASVAYEQLDRLHRLSGELTVSVGAMAGQRTRVRRLARELDQATRQIARVTTGRFHGELRAGATPDREPGGPGAQDGGEALQELLRPILDRLDAIGSGLETLSDVHDRTEGQLQQLTEHLVDEVTQARLVPLSELFDEVPRMARDLARDLGKQVVARIEGDDNPIDRAVLDALRNPLLHLIRNAVDHGIEAPTQRRALGKDETGRLVIEAQQLSSMMRIRVADDGGGIDLERLRQTVVRSARTTEALWAAMGIEEQMQFLFLPGLSTSEQVSDTSGRGFGLDIVKTGLDAIGARIGVHSERGSGCCFELQVPLSLALTRCLLVHGGRHPLFGMQRYAIPMHDVLSVARVDPQQVRWLEGRRAVRRGDETLLLHPLSQLLGLAPASNELGDKHLVILGDGERRGAVLVEAVIDELDVVSRPLDERLGKVQEVAGVTLLDDGGLALVIDTPDLLTRLDEGYVEQTEAPVETPEKVDHILVVEDSVTVREVERHFLTQAGYEVTTAVNGVDGLNKAKAGQHDMLVTDIDMPRMNGIELIRTLRGMERFRALPVIVVSYKDRPEDREAALAAGANRYVTKAEFDTDAMLAMVAELLREAAGDAGSQEQGEA